MFARSPMIVITVGVQPIPIFTDHRSTRILECYTAAVALISTHRSILANPYSYGEPWHAAKGHLENRRKQRRPKMTEGVGT